MSYRKYRKKCHNFFLNEHKNLWRDRTHCFYNNLYLSAKKRGLNKLRFHRFTGIRNLYAKWWKKMSQPVSRVQFGIVYKLFITLFEPVSYRLIVLVNLRWFSNWFAPWLFDKFSWGPFLSRKVTHLNFKGVFIPSSLNIFAHVVSLPCSLSFSALATEPDESEISGA